MWENTVAIHRILNGKNYKAKFLISSILKKVKLTKIIFLKRKKEKRGRYCRKKKVTHCE
jgi:hypothetical protein